MNTLLVSLCSKALIKGSRVAVRQGKDYWIATITRKGAEESGVQYDEGTKGIATNRSMTHLPDNVRKITKPLTKDQVAKLKAPKLKPAVKKVTKKVVTLKEPRDILKEYTEASMAEPVRIALGLFYDIDALEQRIRRMPYNNAELQQHLDELRAKLTEAIKHPDYKKYQKLGEEYRNS